MNIDPLPFIIILFSASITAWVKQKTGQLLQNLEKKVITNAMNIEFLGKEIKTVEKKTEPLQVISNTLTKIEQAVERIEFDIRETKEQITKEMDLKMIPIKQSIEALEKKS